jgi:hypothetical protein
MPTVVGRQSHTVMAGHSRSKNGVASLAYVPAIHVFLHCCVAKTWMPATSAGMTRHCIQRLYPSRASSTALIDTRDQAAVRLRKSA